MDQSDRRYFRQQLPALQFETPFQLDACAPELQELFRLYGYDQIVRHTQCTHYAGQVRLGGFKCVAHCWLPKNHETNAQRQTVVVSHGLFDHSGLYLKLVESLLRANICVFMPDFPGHGISAGEPAAINDFSEYASVISDSVLMLNQQKDVFGPVSLVGQSTGAAAILRYLLDQVYDSGIRKVVLLAPLIKPKSFWFIRLAFPFVRYLGIPIKRRFNNNSHDKEFCQFLAQDDALQPQSIPHTWLQALCDWVEWYEAKWERIASGSERKLQIPTLIVQGLADNTVDWRNNLPKIVSILENPKEEHIPGARHHLVNEAGSYRPKILTAILKFLA
ncbi:alpha/beta hydrolase [Teredinibacter haidensis]|uniref:alpha/beta hydrolase n=1 Tax=Teredinibacter haidensis TaxID=2731755 RepID=UPI000948B668|nr:alpha/beta hydrolase [Teredinibacter haidensis]